MHETENHLNRRSIPAIRTVNKQMLLNSLIVVAKQEVTLHVPRGGSSATATNLMEHPETDDKVELKGDQVTFTVHPWEIQTIRVNYSPSEPTQTAQIP